MQNQAAREAQLGSEYRELCGRIPPIAWKRDTQPSAIPEDPEAARCAYRYFDLCNTQALQFVERRISPKTWSAWRQGIRENLELPWFSEMFIRMHADRGQASAHFTYLDALVPRGLKQAVEERIEAG